MKKVFLVMALVVAGLVLVSGQVFAENDDIVGGVDPRTEITTFTPEHNGSGNRLDLDVDGAGNGVAVFTLALYDNHEAGFKIQVQSTNGVDGGLSSLYLERYDVLTVGDTHNTASKFPYSASFEADLTTLTANGLDSFGCSDAAGLNTDGDVTFTAFSTNGGATVATNNVSFVMKIDWTADDDFLEGLYKDTITFTLTPNI